MGQGPDPRSAGQQAGGANFGGQPTPSPYQGPNGTQWTPAPSGEPEYFGPQPHTPAAPHPGGPTYDSPGHTQAFSLGEAPDAEHAEPSPGYPSEPGYGDDHIATYRAGQAAAPPAGPRLHWKELLTGIFLHPQNTFLRMRDYQMWAPALTVTLLYGVLALFGMEGIRDEFLGSTLATSIPWVIISAAAVALCALMLGAVTNALARQFGGDGAWAPTVGLSMLITSLTDAPRLLFALFLPADNALVQVLGWATWLLCAGLLSYMVSKSHDLPWPRALAVSSIQLIALLVLIKLPVLGS